VQLQDNKPHKQFYVPRVREIAVFISGWLRISAREGEAERLARLAAIWGFLGQHIKTVATGLRVYWNHRQTVLLVLIELAPDQTRTQNDCFVSGRKADPCSECRNG
jgi:hypothetical protein